MCIIYMNIINDLYIHEFSIMILFECSFVLGGFLQCLDNKCSEERLALSEFNFADNLLLYLLCFKGRSQEQFVWG